VLETGQQRMLLRSWNNIRSRRWRCMRCVE